MGDYFDVSDQVIQMMNYEPFDVTSQAHEIADMFPGKREVEDKAYPFHVRERLPRPESIVPLNKYGKFSINAKEVHRIHFGKYDIDLTDLEQLMELSQTKALGYALEYSKKYMDGQNTLRKVVDHVMKILKSMGLILSVKEFPDTLPGSGGWNWTFTLNRLRSFDVTQKDAKPS